MAAGRVVRIESLALRAPGLDAEQARELARAVANALSERLSNHSTRLPGYRGLRMRITVPAQATTQCLAHQIATRIGEALE